MKYCVNVCIRVETQAADEQGAVDDILQQLGHVEDYVSSLDTYVVSCERAPVPAPAGAERWARMAAEVGFREWGSIPESQYAIANGSWWWHDGRTALRCGEGEAPGEMREAGLNFFPPDRVDRAIEWGDVFDRHGEWGPRLACRRATVDGDIIADERYVRLVEGAFAPGKVTWRAGVCPDPIYAIVDGSVVAVVMPVKP